MRSSTGVRGIHAVAETAKQIALGDHADQLVAVHHDGRAGLGLHHPVAASPIALSGATATISVDITSVSCMTQLYR